MTFGCLTTGCSAAQRTNAANADRLPLEALAAAASRGSGASRVLYPSNRAFPVRSLDSNDS